MAICLLQNRRNVCAWTGSIKHLLRQGEVVKRTARIWWSRLSARRIEPVQETRYIRFERIHLKHWRRWMNMDWSQSVNQCHFEWMNLAQLAALIGNNNNIIIVLVLAHWLRSSIPLIRPSISIHHRHAYLSWLTDLAGDWYQTSGLTALSSHQLAGQRRLTPLRI